eukprot:CAMPEP_0179024054 /NCGR_PEP_ID=MMETSP0796-20121207/7254_1 /TAXON_ID=73915 /ORGANISM="Pyrodinium bahamense, Strain pbaha01" /LENGTH=127 /DNA_ID=CAMNT_0020719997 /DNA_START=483 /DNA_END=864 /DNA_ORIENTATION=-
MKARGVLHADQVDEGVAEVEHQAEVDGQVHEIEALRKALESNKCSKSSREKSFGRFLSMTVVAGWSMLSSPSSPAADFLVSFPIHLPTCSGGPPPSMSFSVIGTSDGNGTRMSSSVKAFAVFSNASP